MLLRSAKCCEGPSQTTSASTSPVTRSSSADHARQHHQPHNRRHQERRGLKNGGVDRFEPLRCSTPDRNSFSGTQVVTFGNGGSLEGILTTGKKSKSTETFKRVHFEVEDGVSSADESILDSFGVWRTSDVSGGGSVAGFRGEDATSEWTSASSSTTYTSSRRTGRTTVQHDGLLFRDRSYGLDYGGAMPRTVRRSRATRDVFSSDEERDESGALSAGSSHAESNCRPVYIVRRATTPPKTSQNTGRKRPGSSSGSSSGLVSGAFLSVWRALYGATCSVLLLDTWLLSRLTKRQKRRGCALALLLLPLILLWASGPSDSVAEGKGIVTATTSVVTSAGHVFVKTAGTVRDNLVSASSRMLSLLPEFAWIGGKTDLAKDAEDRISASEWRLGDEERLRKIVRSVVEERLESRAEKPGSEVEESLRTRLEKVAEGCRETSDRVARLKTRVEQLGATAEELSLAKEELRKCCRDGARFLADLDSKIAVLRETESSASPTSESAVRKWILAELSDRDSRLNGVLADLRADVESAAAAARKAEEAVAASAKVRAVQAESGVVEHPDLVAEMKKVVKEAISLYDADKTGMADYALESAGGSVVNTRCTESYTVGAPMYRVFGIPIWRMIRTPRSAIQPDTRPGECWAFRGSQGTLVVQLAKAIRPTGFTVEHIAKSLDPSGNIDSAPREFSIVGLKSETDYGGKLLGKYTYREDGEPLQYFPVQDPEPETFRFVEMVVLSNHGNLEYTCLYRLRVHGVPSRDD